MEDNQNMQSDKKPENSGGPKGLLKRVGHEISEQFKEIFTEFKEERQHKNEERKKEFYGGEAPDTKGMRALYIALYTIKKFFSFIATTVFSVLLICILTGTIVGTVVTVYMLSFMDTAANISLKDVPESFASYIYQMNKETGEYEVVYKVKPADGEIRIKSDIEEIPENVKMAFVCIEDERFYAHEGVDYKRTGAAIANLALSKINMGSGRFGGSTLTQQLIKNITGDNEDSWERKMREIFSAMKFEKKYTKDEILEAYLNWIYFGEIDGYHMYGIEAASIGYFGKSVTELTTAEAAVLAAIPKAPNDWNPTKYYDDNMERKSTCLYKMFELGVISADEYEEAMNQKILVSTMPEFKAKYPNAQKLSENTDDFENPEVNSWAVETAIDEFGDYLKEANHLKTMNEGIALFNKGGYKLYITVDTDIQEHLDSTYEDWTYFPEDLSTTGDMVQSALAVMDYQGHILGVAGQIGEKTVNAGHNHAYMTHRQPGSTIKPVTTYGYVIENDLATWSTYFYDRSLPAGIAESGPWPNNYDGAPSGLYRPLQYFLQQSINTLPAQIAYNYGLDSVFNFATSRLHLDLDPEYDINYAPICVGGTSTGPNVINLANAYMPYGNGGVYYKASMISKAVDLRTGETIIDNVNRDGEQAVSEDTATVMNKLLQKVITNGTGTAAALYNAPLAGKTGTTENWRDITFVGLTPDYVSALWVGYPNGENPYAIEASNSARIWRNVFGTYADANYSGEEFPVSETAVYARYCSYSGYLAGPNCPGGDYGWYKSSNCEYCGMH